MDDDFNPDDLRPIPYRPDTELMLGPWQLGIVFFVLFLFCGIFYLIGYSVGRRSTHYTTASSQSQLSPSSSLGAAPGAKPSAGPQSVSRPRSTAQAVSPARSNGTPASEAPPAQASGQRLMVQIAAVSHQEDADVLVSALRKRGYAVTMRRDPTDSLFHVRIGPFASRDDANAARQKLLNDGYNASVEP
ncbi:MAG: SPOR domain-containing protein [Terracidiphilus sp.]|jgi:cell division septation protein DedD